MTRDKAIEKIKKCLALSESPVPAEAAAALASAQRLMYQFNLTSTDLESEDNDVLKVQLEKSTTGISNNWLKLAVALASHYRCMAYISIKGKNKNIVLVGEKRDVEIFKEVFTYAYAIQETCFKKHLKEVGSKSRSESIKIKNTYCKGYRDALVQALYDNENKYALVVQTPQSVKDELDNVEFTGSYKPSPTKLANLEHYFKGVEDGREFYNNKRAIQ